MADEPRPMSQEEIDALFASMDAEMSGETGEQPVPVEAEEAEPQTVEAAAQPAEEPAQEPAASPAAADSGMLDQSAIDALLQQVAAGDGPQPAAASEPVAAPQTEIEGPADGPLAQNDIDALLAQMQGDGAPVENGASSGSSQASAPEPVPAAQQPDPGPSADAGPLGQGDIDALLAQMQGDVAAPQEAAAAVGSAGDDQQAPSDAEGERTLDQAEIDAMMAAASTTPPADDDNDDDDALAGSDDPGASISQEDIDRMLADLAGGGGADTTGEATRPDQAAVPIEVPAGAVPATEQITADSLQSLIDKHAGGTSRVESSSLINQDDIQLLVDQLTQASGEMPSKDEIDAMLSDREQNVAQLLNKGSSRMSLTDAVQPSMVGMGGASGDGVASGGRVLSPEEWRGTRYLLVAGVLLLGMCSLALVLVVSSINRLTSEIRTGHDAQAVPLSDDFDDDLRYVDSLLSSADSEQIDAGVRHGERLKQRYRNNFAHLDRISWRLAEHHRAQGSHLWAFRELRAMRERSGALMDDPSFYVAYADSLMRIGRSDEAKQALYDLLANEQYYLDDDEDQGRGLDRDQLRRNRTAVRQAFLLLGQLYLAAVDPDLDVEEGLL